MNEDSVSIETEKFSDSLREYLVQLEKQARLLIQDFLIEVLWTLRRTLAHISPIILMLLLFISLRLKQKRFHSGL